MPVLYFTEAEAKTRAQATANKHVRKSTAPPRACHGVFQLVSVKVE